MRLDMGPQTAEISNSTRAKAKAAVEILQEFISSVKGRPGVFGRTGVDIEWHDGQIVAIRPTASTRIHNLGAGTVDRAADNRSGQQ